jgi:hypothetical protein
MLRTLHQSLQVWGSNLTRHQQALIMVLTTPAAEVPGQSTELTKARGDSDDGHRHRRQIRVSFWQGQGAFEDSDLIRGGPHVTDAVIDAHQQFYTFPPHCVWLHR